MAENEATDQAFLTDELKGIRPEPTYGGALSFFRRKYTRDLTGVDVAVTGIPFDTATTNRAGARMGPRAVRAATSHLAWERPYGWDFSPFDRLAVVDYGDCLFDLGKPLDTPDVITAHIAAIIDGGATTLVLGGDHYISYPVIRAHARQQGGLSLIQFDAHTDTWNEGGNEAGRIDHGTMFYHAVTEGLVEPDRSVQVGIRTTNDDPMGVHILDAPWVHKNGPEAAIDEIRRIVGGNRVYMTFDIDCLDPAYAPGTGTPVIGGLSPYQVQTILRGLAGINLIAMDVVEVAPAYDHAEITALAAATIAYDMLALYAAKS